MNQGGRANHHGLNAPLRIRQVIKRYILETSIYIFVLTGCTWWSRSVCFTWWSQLVIMTNCGHFCNTCE